MKDDKNIDIKNNSKQSKEKKISKKKLIKSININKAKEFYILSEIFDKAKGLKKWW